MAAQQNFRSAFNGFNREDVVRYIEYINAKYKTETNQLQSQIDSLKRELESKAAPAEDSGRCAALEQEVAQLRLELEQAKAAAGENELEMYRRAERVEREAQERAAQVRTHTNGILADASARVDNAAGALGAMAEQVAEQINRLQEAVLGSKQALSEAAEALYALAPDQE